jgi:hypothetical protein
VQILVVVATNRMPISMTEVDKGSRETAIDSGLVEPKRRSSTPANAKGDIVDIL